MSGLLQQPIAHQERETHPSRRRWDLFCLGELSSKEQALLHQHLEKCSRCQSQVSLIRTEQSDFSQQFTRAAFLRTLESLPTASLQDTSSQISTIAKEGAPKQSPPSEGLLSWWKGMMQTWGSMRWWLAPVGAMGLMLLVWRPFSQDGVDRSPPPGRTTKPPVVSDVWRLKGSAPQLKVFMKRGATQRNARSGESFRAGDLLGFSYRGAGFAYLTVILVDAKSSISWLYPEKPAQSIPIAAHGALRGSAELDDAHGKERLLAFFAERPLSSQQIQQLLPTLRPGLQKLQGQTFFLQEFVIQK
ncbi:MAG: hypothetical protein H6728_09605 [Myxococcales bacterium]|nr:hypothetical protein [Myxococcales bacterium]